MPASQFFLMLDEAQVMRAMNYSALCDIAAIPGCKSEYHEMLKESFSRVIVGESPELPEKPATPAIASSSVEAKYAVMDLFSRATVH